MDIIASCLLDSEEIRDVFTDAKGFEVLINAAKKHQGVLARDALKVISFALTNATIDRAEYFISKASGLGFLFGLWMKQPDVVRHTSS